MSHPLTDVSNFDTSITVPDDGDAGAAASVGVGFQSLANRTKWLNDNKLTLTGGTLTGGLIGTSLSGTSFPFAGAPPTVNRNQPALFASGDGSRWSYDRNFLKWYQSSVASAGTLFIPLSNLVDGATLISVSVAYSGKYATGMVGHAGLPATMPTVSLQRISASGLVQIGATITDTSGSFAVYDGGHNILIPSLTEVITETSDYVVYITGEAGANSVANTSGVLGVTATFSVPTNSPGG